MSSFVPPVVCPDSLSVEQQDEFWMGYAIQLAQQAELQGEIPVGAVLVQDNRWIAEGYNLSIGMHDPTAHAEILALRAAGDRLQNYRMLGLTLYVTLEPCPMCASALVHARIKKVIYGAADLKTGAIDSVFNLANNGLLNHQVESEGGVLAERCSAQLSAFFKKRRAEKKAQKKLKFQVCSEFPIKI